MEVLGEADHQACLLLSGEGGQTTRAHLEKSLRVSRMSLKEDRLSMCQVMLTTGAPSPGALPLPLALGSSDSGFSGACSGEPACLRHNVCGWGAPGEGGCASGQLMHPRSRGCSRVHHGQLVAA